MTTTTTAPAEWHGFSWTADGHTPKIDIRTPAMVAAGFTADEALALR
jgi:hypothetical protein